MVSSLQARLLLATSLLAIVAVLAVALAVRQGTRREFVKFREELRTPAPKAALTDPAMLVDRLDGTCCRADALADAAARLQSRELLAVIDDHGKQVALVASPGLSDVEEGQVTRSGDTLTLHMMRGAGGLREQFVLQFTAPGRPLSLSDGRAARLYVLPVPARDSGPAEAFLQSVDRRLMLTTAIVGLVAIGATWLITRRIVGPVRELQRATAAVAGGDFTTRIVVRGHDEMAKLGHAFNSMSGELQRQRELRDQLVHDVVHELRTPLTGLRCRIESIIDGMATNPQQALEGATEDVVQLGRLIDDLHEIALAEARALRLDIGRLAVTPLLNSALRGAALEGDPRVQLEAEPDLFVNADPVRTRQVLMNLLTNAARHTPATGRIVVRAVGAAAEILVDVHNTGSSLTCEQLARVFDRFYRADPSRQRTTGGTGLGLAIAKTLVEAQGGRVWVRREADGVTFGFALPRSSAR